MSLHQEASSHQYVFRSLVAAMSRPGAVIPLPSEHLPEGQEGPLLAVCRALLDPEVTFAVISQSEDNPLAEAIATATGARPANPSRADYLVVVGNDSRGAVLEAKRGVPEYPDQGTTILYYLDGDSMNGSAARVCLSGPGNARERTVEIATACREEWERIRRCNQEYPLGVDCIFVLPRGKVMGVPRSAGIRVE